MEEQIVSFDADRGNFRKFINKFRRRLRATILMRDGLPIFDGTFRGWWIVVLRTYGATVKLKINSRNFYFHGFQNSNGDWWRLNEENIDDFGASSVFTYNGNYAQLRARASVFHLHDVHLSRQSITHAILVLSNFNGDLEDQGVPLAILKMVLTICESTRFHLIQKRIHHFFRGNKLTPKLTFLETSFLTRWEAITNIYFSGDFANISQLGIVSRADIKKVLAIGLVTSTAENSGSGAGGDGPGDGRGGDSQEDGGNNNKKGSASREKKSSGNVNQKKVSRVAHKGKGVNTVAPLQLDFKGNSVAAYLKLKLKVIGEMKIQMDNSLDGFLYDMASLDHELERQWRRISQFITLQGIHGCCIRHLAWNKRMLTNSCQGYLTQLQAVHNYQGLHHKIQNHLRDAKQFLLAPAFEFVAPPQSSQFHAGQALTVGHNFWWKSLSATQVLKYVLPSLIFNQTPAIKTVTTSASFSHLQLAHFLFGPSVLRDAFKVPIIMSAVTAAWSNPESSFTRICLSLPKWFKPAPELPISPRWCSLLKCGHMGASSLTQDLSVSRMGGHSSFVARIL